MSDEVLTIKLTEREIDLLHECISTNMETVKRRHDVDGGMAADLLQELGELSDDLLSNYIAAMMIGRVAHLYWQRMI